MEGLAGAAAASMPAGEVDVEGFRRIETAARADGASGADLYRLAAYLGEAIRSAHPSFSWGYASEVWPRRPVLVWVQPPERSRSVRQAGKVTWTIDPLRAIDLVRRNGLDHSLDEELRTVAPVIANRSGALASGTARRVYLPSSLRSIPDRLRWDRHRREALRERHP